MSASRLRSLWLSPLAIGGAVSLASFSPLSLARSQAAEPIANLAAGSLLEETTAKGFLSKGDQVVWIGSGFVERMQQSNWVDLIIGAADPTLKFRNIGWSGDTVFGDARGVFGGREDGYKRLVGDLEKTHATACLVCYGENECREGAAGLKAFDQGYRRLLQELLNKKGKVALVLPRRFEKDAVPNSEVWNEQLAIYNLQSKKIAKELGLPVIDLENFEPGKKLSTDGIYWSSDGYRLVGLEIAKQLGLKLDERWSRQIQESPNAATLANYRDLIRQKNEWFFHYYRPQNETYLFLFRKHEQGNNAAELEKITPEIESLEGRIREALGGKS